MKTITFAAFRAQIESRKTAIGWADDEAGTEVLRNAGLLRTPSKREQLERIAKRARASGQKPVRAHF